MWRLRKEGILVENWLNEENGEIKNASEVAYMKDKRSVLGMPKERPFQVKDADDPSIE